MGAGKCLRRSGVSKKAYIAYERKKAFRKQFALRRAFSIYRVSRNPLQLLGEDPGLLTQYVGIDSSGGKIRIKIQVIVQTFFEKLLHDKTLPLFPYRLRTSCNASRFNMSMIGGV